MEEHYKTLKIKKEASLDEIKKASRKLLLKYHPDLHPNNQKWAQEKTKKIINAYTILSQSVDKASFSFRSAQDIRKNQQSNFVSTKALMQFSVGSLSFAIPVENIKRIEALSTLKITKISNRKGLYPFIIGIIYHNGTVSPLLDLGEKLNLENNQGHKQVLICETEGQPIALIIDEGKGILNVSINDFNNSKHMDKNDIPQEYLINVIKENNEKVHVLDLTRILTH